LKSISKWQQGIADQNLPRVETLSGVRSWKSRVQSVRARIVLPYGEAATPQLKRTSAYRLDRLRGLHVLQGLA